MREHVCSRNRCLYSWGAFFVMVQVYSMFSIFLVITGKNPIDAGFMKAVHAVHPTQQKAHCCQLPLCVVVGVLAKSEHKPSRESSDSSLQLKRNFLEDFTPGPAIGEFDQC